MRVLVLGAGGLGGYFGGRLVEAGADVSFLVREARADRLRARGLVIESPLGDAVIPVKAVTGGGVGGDVDLVVLSCKAYDLDGAIAAIRPVVGERTSILPLLNGLAHLDRLDAAFGPERVLGGLAHISATLGPDGTVRHLGKLATLTFGARRDDPDERARCDRIAALMEPASFTARRSGHVLQDMWEKFVFITAAAAVTCLMRASTGAILAAPDGERLVLQMLEECEAVAAASGHPVRDKARAWARDFLLQRGSDFTTSMLRDLEAGARVEADHLQGDMVERAAALALPTELLRTAYCHLKSYEQRRIAEAAAG